MAVAVVLDRQGVSAVVLDRPVVAEAQVAMEATVEKTGATAYQRSLRMEQGQAAVVAQAGMEVTVQVTLHKAVMVAPEGPAQ